MRPLRVCISIMFSRRGRQQLVESGGAVSPPGDGELLYRVNSDGSMSDRSLGVENNRDSGSTYGSLKE